MRLRTVNAGVKSTFGPDDELWGLHWYLAYALGLHCYLAYAIDMMNCLGKANHRLEMGKTEN